jgi:hypothetical protein
MSYVWTARRTQYSACSSQAPASVAGRHLFPSSASGFGVWLPLFLSFASVHSRALQQTSDPPFSSVRCRHWGQIQCGFSSTVSRLFLNPTICDLEKNLYNLCTTPQCRLHQRVSFKCIGLALIGSQAYQCLDHITLTGGCSSDQCCDPISIAFVDKRSWNVKCACSCVSVLV